MNCIHVVPGTAWVVEAFAGLGIVLVIIVVVVPIAWYLTRRM